MITRDYSSKAIIAEEYEDLKAISGVSISNLELEDYPNLLVFPDSFYEYDREFGKKAICSIDDNKRLYTNSIVGFVGRNNTHLSIHSRFANDTDSDFFLHYMLQKVANVNILNLQHTLDDDSVFDFLIYLFPLYLKKALRQGVFKQYTSHKYNDANVRGTIDINRHIRNNVPFNGKVAYNTREYSYDNDVTQLIRHTIEYICRYKCGSDILATDQETQAAVSQIISATPSFSQRDISAILNRNIRPVVHPYYNEYTPLQRLCLQILKHEELKYGQKEDEMYGVLIDAAWLWEEYVAIILEGQFVHYLKDRGKRFYLFEPNFQQIIPDYLSLDKSVVADAKYIPLNRESSYGEEKATSIFYKTITYMYRFCAKKAFLFYPHHPEDYFHIDTLTIKTDTAGINGGSIIKQGLKIPSQCGNYIEFVKQMRISEDEMLQQLNL